MKKEVKRLKKEKAMFNNMETHLNHIGIKAKKVKISIETKDEKEEDFHPEFVIQGSHETNKLFNFRIDISEKEKNLNGNLQVQLHMEIEKDKYVTLFPQTNGQLAFMIQNFQVGMKKFEIIKEKEEKKETIKA